MVIITLVGEMLAKKDESFVYCGPLSECRDCKLKTVCFNLESGRWYRVSAIRDVHHECKIHENGVRVVEVEIVGFPASVPKRLAIEGTIVAIEPAACGKLSCGNYRRCHPIGIEDGGRYQIISVNGDIECENGRQLEMVTLI